MKRNEENSTKRPKKIMAGDHIRRSEYNDSTMRSNNRCNNRLSQEMQLFEKAQKIILKDIGKETHILRSKLGLQASSIPTPRQNFTRNTSFVLEPYTVYSMNSKQKESPRKQKQTTTPRVPRDQTNSVSGIYAHQNVGSRHGLLQPMTIRRLSNDSTISYNPIDQNRMTEAAVQNSKDKLVIKRKSKLKLENKPHAHDKMSEISGRSSSRVLGSRMMSVDTGSRLDFRGEQRASALSGHLSSRLHNASPTTGSRMSFIDILAEAEERKAKELVAEEMKAREAEQEALAAAQLLTPRPRSSRPNSDVRTRHGATPNATLCSTPVH